MDVIVTGNRCVIYEDDTYYNGDRIEDIDSKEARRLIKKGHARQADASGVIARTPPIDEMKVSELKALLDKLEVDYPSDAKKADLVELVKKHTGAPPAE